MNDGIFHKILSVPLNIGMDLNNVMPLQLGAQINIKHPPTPLLCIELLLYHLRNLRLNMELNNGYSKFWVHVESNLPI